MQAVMSLGTEAQLSGVEWGRNGIVDGGFGYGGLLTDAGCVCVCVRRPTHWDLRVAVV
jgi:hypothetical protein